MSKLETDRFAPGDRILFLYIPELADLEAVSRAAPNGIAVCLGDRDAVYAARKPAAHLENVMFVPAEPHEIPWQEGFFNHVFERGIAGDDAVRAEICRVLAPGGSLYSKPD